LWRVGATLLLTAPITPLLLMGEEWGAGTRWQRVASQPEPELATVAVNGRHPELAAPGGPDGDVPEPHGFPPAGLDWAELDKPEHREILDFYRRLITLRKSRPDLSDPNLERLDVRYGDQFVVVRRGRCFVAANLAGKAQRITLPDVVRAVLLATRDGVIVMRDGVELPAESAAVVAA
jgi:maltooligosyltrehalose trehalohydrolase